MEELKIDYPSILEFVLQRTKVGYDLVETLKSLIIDFLPDVRLHGYGICLTPLQITTATMAYNSNIKMDYRVMAKYISSNNKDIIAVKSPALSLEECLKNEHTRANIINRRRKKVRAKKTNALTKQYRTTTGNGLYFTSSVELVIGRPLDSGGYKKYNVRISPSKGSIQIQGLDNPIYKNANKYINRVLEYIQESLEEDEPYIVHNARLIIVNFKTEVECDDPTECIKLMELSNIVRHLIDRRDTTLSHQLPYNIIYNTEEEDIGSYIRLKFLTIAPNGTPRKITVKIFSGRKINILGSAHTVDAIKIYTFLDRLFNIYHANFIIYKVPRLSLRKSRNRASWTELF